MKPQTTGRKVAELFFNKVNDDTDMWQCRCGKKRKRSNKSYENLLSHIRSAHKGYEKLMVGDLTQQQTQISSFFNSDVAQNYFGWFNYIINGLKPFSDVESAVVRESMRFKPMSLSTFMRYLPRLVALVEKKISNLLPNKFAIVFDGWTAGTTHYLGVFASFTAHNENGYSTRLLGFSPMGDETTLDADEHVGYLSYVLELFGYSFENVVALIGDNCNTNKSIANKLSLPLIGCASHRFNLAVQDILSEHETLLFKVHALMKKLRTPLMAARLAKQTPLNAKTQNVTRWSSSFDMLRRYNELREFLHHLNSTELDAYFLSTAEDRRVNELLDRLQNLNSITKRLQRDSTTMKTVRALFDFVMTDYPETDNRLTATAAIVHSPAFESAIVKVQSEESSTLTHEERQSIQRFEILSGALNRGNNDSLSYDARALLAQESNSFSGKKYQDLRFLIPTSNVCERLFSKAGYTLGDRRMSLLPANLESQLFLHLNKDLWSVSDLNELTIETMNAQEDS